MGCVASVHQDVEGCTSTPGRQLRRAGGAGGSASHRTDVGTPEFRRRFKDASGKEISPWHDVDLKVSDGVYNAVIEIPKTTNPKFEVSTREPNNPIAQHVKKGKLPEYHGPIFWNYGMFPQTSWEDPSINSEIQRAGDGEPVDVVEIGSATIEPGSVVPVKPLGVLAMIDDGELDWKVIAISTTDPLAPELNDIGDVSAKCPGVIDGIREWFRLCKTPDGKPLNAFCFKEIDGIREWFQLYKTPDGKTLDAFGLKEEALDKAKAIKVLDETHRHWTALRDGSSKAVELWTGIAGASVGVELISESRTVV